MALPSQTARITLSGRTYGMRRRRRSNRPLFVAIGALAALVVVVWWATRPSGSGPDGSQAAQPPAGTEPTLLASAPSPDPEPPPPPIVEIGQGRLSAAPASDPGSSAPLASAQDAGPVAPLASTLRTSDDSPESSEAPRVAETIRTPGAAPSNLPADLAQTLSGGRAQLGSGDLVGARVSLSRLLADPRTPPADQQALRDELARINDELVFSPRVVEGDPFTTMYTVVRNDGLERIARKTAAAGHWRLIQRVNRLSNPRGIREGQPLKIVKGPFHAIVTKADFRLDVFMGDAATPSEWVYVKSFPVGLGADNGTPTGTFVVKTNSKLENPYWVNPRTGEQFHKDDPKNPIGERWIGLQGQGEAAAVAGIGIHGTIEPESIGKERSMGCVRLGMDEVEIVYDLLSEGTSVVIIRP